MLASLLARVNSCVTKPSDTSLQCQQRGGRGAIGSQCCRQVGTHSAFVLVSSARTAVTAATDAACP